MRITGTKFDTILNAMKAVIDFYGGPAIVKKMAEEKKYTQKRMLWDVWHVAHDNLRYDDTHPMFAQKKRDRIIPQNTSFDMYSNGDNDDHFDTALRVVGKRLGII
jgi:hypothetical protein